MTDGKWAAEFPRYILNACNVAMLRDIRWDGDHWSSGDPPEVFSTIKEFGTTVICIPGDEAAALDSYAHLNLVASKFDKVIWLIFSDEQGLFDASLLEHPNQKVWIFAPQSRDWAYGPGYVDRLAPFGWTTGTKGLVARAVNGKRYNWSFLGQVTHNRRFECVAAARSIPNGLLHESKAFAMGVSRDEYFQALVNSRFALCPGGPCTADSFRFAEALEAGAIPVADDFPGERDWPAGYWEAVCGKNLPFPVIRDWSTLPDVLKEWNEDYELKRERCARWWAIYKNGLVERMREDLT